MKKSQFIALYSIIYFSFCYLFAYVWYSNGYFSIFDVFFDTDPNVNLMGFAHGWGRHAISHPFLEVFAILPRILGIVLSKLDLINDVKLFRDIISLSVSPLFSALSLFFFYKLLVELKISEFESVLLTIIFSLLFSNIIFGIIPEVYAISCFFIILLYYYFLVCSNLSSAGDIKIWLVIAVLLTGITITNINIFFIVYLIHLIRTCRLKFMPAFFKASLASLAVLIFAIAFYYASRIPFDIPLGGDANADWIKRFTATSIHDVVRNFFNLVTASVYSIFGVFQQAVMNPHCVDIPCKKFVYLDSINNNLVITAFVIFVIIYIIKCIKQDAYKDWSNLFVISGLVILYNLFFHMYFGRGMFLYTQHWILPMFLFLIPVIRKNNYILLLSILVLLVADLSFLFTVESRLSV